MSSFKDGDFVYVMGYLKGTDYREVPGYIVSKIAIGDYKGYYNVEIEGQVWLIKENCIKNPNDFFELKDKQRDTELANLKKVVHLREWKLVNKLKDLLGVE